MEVHDHGHRDEGHGDTALGSELLSESSAVAPSLSADLQTELKASLAGKTGKQYWRSLEELSDSPQMQRFMDDEFPNRSSLAQINRRDMLKFMGASMALAGLSGCRSVFMPQEKLVPYVKAPEELVPGMPLFYASSMMLGGYATGVLVEQHEGRPTRLEGNPEHGSSLGALDSLSQAEILNLYDPDRTSVVTEKDDISTWDLFTERIGVQLELQNSIGGAGVRILTGAISSPSTIEQIENFLKTYPQARWHSYEPVGRGGVYAGAKAAFGRALEPIYDFSKEKTKAILTLDADFMSAASMPGSLRYAREFAEGRRVVGDRGDMNRLYAIESTPTLCGAMADHRWPVKSAQIYGIALNLAAALGLPVQASSTNTIPAEHFAAMVEDLRANKGVVVCGDFQPPHVHALVHAINQSLGAIGRSVRFVEPVNAAATRAGDLLPLLDDLQAGTVELLFIIGGNPLYDAPAEYQFAESLKKAKYKIHHTLYENETSQLCSWVLPATHFLEEWGDGLGHDGSVSMIQPVIAPLYEGRSVAELFSLLNRKPRGSYDIVRDYWRRNGLGGGNFEKSWRQFVHDGVLKKPVVEFSGTPAVSFATLPAPTETSGWEITFRADPTIYDGRFANNGWLQELPKPLTKLTWDNTAIIGPADATEMGLHIDDVVRITYKGTTVEAGVFVLPGQPRQCLTVHLGYGRTRGGVIATVQGDHGGGFNAYLLRRADAPFFSDGVTIEKVGTEMNLATTQTHQPIEAAKRPPGLEGSVVPQFPGDHREVILDYKLDFFNEHINEEVEKRAEISKEIRENNLFPEEIFDWKGEQWAMTIDLNTCIGCNACVTACQSENNIPVVGKVQVGRHREMHWIRIDRYYSGSGDNPTINWQPVTCVHCEKAPCEPVCPVAATVHSQEGLNQMIYNRCVGTRYCSNNCPYKVRRFNYLNFSDNQRQFATWANLDQQQKNPEAAVGVTEKNRRPLLKMLNNPDVTVRGRGVMEKCTYCVQRINNARIEAKKANRRIKDGEIVTACQQACPTQTIVFGDQTDPAARVTKLRKDPRAYLLLEELQTRPRTSHLAKLRNPNPAIEPAQTAEAAH
ncbi:MAG: TAT-variant-translocated molybdopterin oxidoreductase [Fimbriimonas sp.]